MTRGGRKGEQRRFFWVCVCEDTQEGRTDSARLGKACCPGFAYFTTASGSSKKKKRGCKSCQEGLRLTKRDYERVNGRKSNEPVHFVEREGCFSVIKNGKPGSFR